VYVGRTLLINPMGNKEEMNKFLEIVRKWRDAVDLTEEEKIAFIRKELDDEPDNVLEVRVLYWN
jgi:hypothetical protein